jgi:mono/diheme cytochrome c family protein
MSGMPCHGNVQANMPGATLFQTKNCSSCHTIGGGNSAGPDLKGLFKLHNEDWVRKMIMNPNKMTIKDPAAVQLKTQFGMQMPNANLTPAELDQLVEYLKVATQ